MSDSSSIASSISVEPQPGHFLRAKASLTRSDARINDPSPTAQPVVGVTPASRVWPRVNDHIAPTHPMNATPAGIMVDMPGFRPLRSVCGTWHNALVNVFSYGEGESLPLFSMSLLN